MTLPTATQRDQALGVLRRIRDQACDPESQEWSALTEAESTVHAIYERREYAK